MKQKRHICQIYEQNIIIHKDYISEYQLISRQLTMRRSYALTVTKITRHGRNTILKGVCKRDTL